MLILIRKLGESIIIGDDIKVQILSSGNNYVRLGITAPRDIPVHREEIYQKIQQEKIDSTDEDIYNV